MNTLSLIIYGCLAVVTTVLWMMWLDYEAAMRLLRAECLLVGHTFDEPFGGMGGQHRNCSRCKTQQHQKENGDWE